MESLRKSYVVVLTVAKCPAPGYPAVVRKKEHGFRAARRPCSFLAWRLKARRHIDADVRRGVEAISILWRGVTPPCVRWVASMPVAIPSTVADEVRRLIGEGLFGRARRQADGCRTVDRCARPRGIADPSMTRCHPVPDLDLTGRLMGFPGQGGAR